MALEIKGSIKEFWKNNIAINIWDDYEDGRDTYAYVEDDDIGEKEKWAIMEVVFDHLKKLDDVESSLDGENINFTNLTHSRLEKLVEELDTAGLKHNDKPIRFYSES